MRTWVLCVSLLAALWGCSKITITEKAPELTVVAKGRVFQSMEGVIAQTRVAINSICQDRLKPEDKKKVASSKKPLYGDVKQALDETLKLIQTAKSILEELVPVHTVTRTVQCTGHTSSANQKQGANRT